VSAVSAGKTYKLLKLRLENKNKAFMLYLILYSYFLKFIYKKLLKLLTILPKPYKQRLGAVSRSVSRSTLTADSADAKISSYSS
jgi:hypothetical protein